MILPQKPFPGFEAVQLKPLDLNESKFSSREVVQKWNYNEGTENSEYFDFDDSFMLYYSHDHKYVINVDNAMSFKTALLRMDRRFDLEGVVIVKAKPRHPPQPINVKKYQIDNFIPQTITSFHCMLYRNQQKIADLFFCNNQQVLQDLLNSDCFIHVRSRNIFIPVLRIDLAQRLIDFCQTNFPNSPLNLNFTVLENQLSFFLGVKDKEDQKKFDQCVTTPYTVDFFFHSKLSSFEISLLFQRKKLIGHFLLCVRSLKVKVYKNIILSIFNFL